MSFWNVHFSAKGLVNSISNALDYGKWTIDSDENEFKPPACFSRVMFLLISINLITFTWNIFFSKHFITFSSILIRSKEGFISFLDSLLLNLICIEKCILLLHFTLCAQYTHECIKHMFYLIKMMLFLLLLLLLLLLIMMMMMLIVA